MSIFLFRAFEDGFSFVFELISCRVLFVEVSNQQLITNCGSEIEWYKVTSISMLQADKRAHHNALERKRRDHIKESFNSLRDTLPKIKGEKVTLVVRTNCN